MVTLQMLVDNAIKYSSSAPEILIRTWNDDHLIILEISDNGIGIPAAELDRIFERFYRVDYARSRANGGTGLGLAIVKHIAAIHGGDVSVWSQVGQGSTFTIKIPAHLHEAVPTVLEQMTSASPQRPPDQLTHEPQGINQ